MQKAHKLIDRDKVDFMLGNVNSAMALAIGDVTSQAGILHIVTGGHTDAVTGKDCHWNVFRVCNTTRMETNSVSKVLFEKFGKKWYFITPDYAFGHTLQQGFEASLKKFGGTEVGASLTPLGTTDFSSYLIKAQAANPDVIIFLTAGQDAVNSLKQAVQFGLNKKFHIAGAQQELEVLEGLPPNARIGTWVFEWYWNQPNVPHVKEFVAEIRKKNGGKVPTARHWFGYASVWTCALIANEKKTLDAAKLAKATGRLPTAAGSGADAGQGLLPRRRPSAHARPLCWACRVERARCRKTCSTSITSSKASTRLCRSRKNGCHPNSRPEQR